MEFINKTGVDRIKLNPYVVPIAVGENTLLINPLHGTADLVSNDEAEYAQCCTPGIWPEFRVLGSPSLIPFPQLSGCDATNGLRWFQIVVVRALRISSCLRRIWIMLRP